MKKYALDLILKGRDTEGLSSEVILKLPGKRTAVAFRLNRKETKSIFRVMPKKGEQYSFRMEVRPTEIEFTKYQGRTPVVQMILPG